MPLTEPIPETAMPVVEAIRKDVPKPKLLPTPSIPAGEAFLRFPMKHGSMYGSCPMGLHPSATSDVPIYPRGFGVDEIPDSAVVAFGYWWDDQTDARAAVDAVWGE